MNARRLCILALLLCSSGFFGTAQQQTGIQSFAPQGTVQRVRQVQVRFSEPMVAFGDPHVDATPFNINCSEKGTGRWVDSANWAYDFERDLPAGIRCEFAVRVNLKSLNGNDITGQRRFQFSTGGPAVVMSYPYQGSRSISDDQIFVLELNGLPVESSVLQNVFFSVQNISEKIGIRIVSGQEKEAILDTVYRYHRKRPDNLLLIQAKQRFPAKAQVNLVWGQGVQSPTGVATSRDQILPFVTQVPFTATFHCQRENPEAQCVPVGAMHVSFSAPVLWKTAKNIILKGPGEKVWQARTPREDSAREEDLTVQDVTFNPPFPERASFTIEIPSGIVDDAGHKLVNAGSFPLQVRTDEYPALAKFAADFGVLELKSDPVLPVTLRNIEPEISGKVFEARGGEENFDPIVPPPGFAPIRGDVRGRIVRVPSDKANQMLAWIDKISRRRYEDRDKSIFGPATAPKAKSFKLPKPNGGNPFEVIGIPLPDPGFYVVELESEMLGAALLGVSKPMFVPTTVLVTNLSVHFKWGVESSLVWVTTLDKAVPVKQAKVEIRDCAGKVHDQGTTDANGIARFGKLPWLQTLPVCSQGDWYEQRGLLATAQLNNDMAFVHSTWNQGIENWRYNLPSEVNPYNWNPTLRWAHTILDRSLFRAGETVHMKHILRQRVVAGLALSTAEQQPKTVVIQHFGSDQKYEIPVKWDSTGVAETTWTIPKEGRLGNYQIYFTVPGENQEKQREFGFNVHALYSGSFRVEEYRVPLMRAIIRPPSEPLVNPSAIPVDLTVSYLSGGGAAGIPVKFRHDVKPRYISGTEGFEAYTFSNGSVKEGLFRGDREQDENIEITLKSSDLNLDKSGSARTTISGLTPSETPTQVLTELEFRDPNGEVQTASASIPLWPSSRLIGIQPDSWMQSKNSLKFKIAVLNLNRKPMANAPVDMVLFQRKTYSHRKRLVGGFYAYEHYTEVKRLGPVCNGKTDNKGLFICTASATTSGELLIQASSLDETGHVAVANRSIWVAGENDWWFPVTDDDRMDLLPEKKRYEPGQKARFQVRMPFRKATALISIEREGIGETFVKEISGKEPVIEIPVKGSYAPNIFVSVLAVRGRVSSTKPTATVDLGKPAYKLGLAEINVGWNTHELKVRVSADRSQYNVREKAKIRIEVATPEGAPPPKGAEVALAAVDEGLLELMPNNSWLLLEGMMGRRGYNVQTSTAQMHVIGKRHFGLKALPQGGGGGSQITRELFDTLLLWKGRVPLDAKGLATVEVPLNDSITSFRIVAVANAGVDRFGTGSTSIRSTRDLILLSGIAPVVRQGDRYRSTFTLRNTTERMLNVRLSINVAGIKEPLPPQTTDVGSGESKEIFWNLTAPSGIDSLRYQIEATATEEISDRLSVTQKIVPAVPVRAFQATLTQLSGDYRLDVEHPKESLPGLGGLDVSVKPKLVEGMTGISDYMRWYPYTCLEQLVSKAVALHDAELWSRIAAEMPAYIDSEGLLKYFPMTRLGSDSLTSYALAITQEAGLEIPPGIKRRMIDGLRGFAEGRVIRYSSLPTVDLSVRKLAAIAALSRVKQADAGLLSSFSLEPNLWPTSALIDWMEILEKIPSIRDRDARRREAEQILRARLNFQGTTMGFSTERTDCLWWLMVSPDENAVRLILNVLESQNWKPDIPRLVRGALGRQKKGHWDTTVANAWGVLAMGKFSKLFENTAVTGSITLALAGSTQIFNWVESSQGGKFSFPWPAQKSTLALHMEGTGQPWATIRSLAAIPLKQPVSTGFRIKKTVTGVEQKNPGVWSRGDLMRVRLELEAQSDMTWVVVDDPIPAGAAILGSGLGRDSAFATKGEKQEGWVWPAFEERSFEAMRTYYEYVPKGAWVIEYTIRLNNEGTMNMPPTRVEAMYSPEMFGEIPNQPLEIK